MNNNQQLPFFYPMFFQQTAMNQFPNFFHQIQGYVQNFPQSQPTAYNQQIPQYQPKPQPTVYNQQFPQYQPQPQQNVFPPIFPHSGIKPQQSPVNKTVQQTSKPVSVVANKPVSTGLTPERFTAKGLMQEDLDEIISKYGDEIDDIFNLAPGQSWMFGKAHKVTNAFFLQEFIKITMKLKPSTFRQRVDAMSLKRTNLRTAYSYRGQKTPYQVVLKNRRPELQFVDRSDKTLEELEEEIKQFRAADRRRGFDLEHDPLLRITVFKTSEVDTYALIISQPHINHDGASMMAIYKELLVDYAVDGKVELPELAAGSYQDYANYLQNIDKESELKYWTELLSGSGVTRLPGRITTTLEPAINSHILRFDGKQGRRAAYLPKKYKATMNSIVQSAWGVMLNKIYGTEDAVFGSITSGRSAEVANSNTMTGGFVNAFPVRVKLNSGETFADLVNRIQKQIISSMQKAHCSPDEIGNRLDLKEPVFDHLLNFHNFADMTKKMPEFPGLSILGMECFDNLSTGLCVYFRLDGNGLNCDFSYDRHSFPERKIQILANCFRQIMEQIIADDERKLTVDELQCNDISAFITAQRDEEEERTRLESFLRTVSLFSGVDDASIAKLAEHSEVISYSYGDEIFREKKQLDGIHILMDGYVMLSKNTVDGWENPLIVIIKGKILSASGVLNNEISSITARASSRQVHVVYIPREAIQNFMKIHSEVALNLISWQEALVNRLSSLWVNAQ